MFLNYRGDITADVIGRVMGPDRHGAYYEAVRAEFVPLADMTRVKFRPVSKNDQREAAPDEFGELRIVSDAPETA